MEHRGVGMPGAGTVRTRRSQGPYRALRATDRRGRWRRGVLRRVAAAILVGSAAWAATSALAPDPPDPGTAVVVAAHDIPVGALLGSGDLHTVRLPEEVVPDGVFTRVEDVHGDVVNAPLRAGEPLTDVRVGLADTLTGLPDGLVLTHVPVPEPALAAMVRPGTRVDLLSAVDGSVLAGDVLVAALSTPRDDSPDLGLGADVAAAAPAGFYAAVTDDEAARLATATGVMSGGVTVVLRRPEPPR